ncbi:MAG: FixH family protein [Mucilaginibacter sp.]|uniref:FixH family protein n=1 Tax=Mucilaginibacter sp. L3T2-6 TaxID=3062491 RepID=UPI00267493AE|nr:FixH family protein [Mucilaginibacter sp. L3T2-6]MDO3643636.1 hypothetical protein [Mucilaginibacter sp. L3T2-6]MDV6216116.1 hypothetical protein [Mucilaginibacter sp. L3T2-6]
MEPLQFNFSHPVNGKVRLFNRVDPHATRVIQVKEEDGQEIGIPLNDLCSGRWTATLEWEYDGKNYCYAQEFEIP